MHKLIEKHTKDFVEKIRIESESALTEIKYLQMHNKRTSKFKGSFIMIPQPYFLGECYGDGKIFWHLRSELSRQDYWMRDKPESYMESFTLESILKVLVTNSQILASIFLVDSGNRHDINVEFVAEFLEFSKYIKQTYPDIYRNDIWTLFDISYSHCSRYCEKVEKFSAELERLMALDKESEVEGEKI